MAKLSTSPIDIVSFVQSRLVTAASRRCKPLSLGICMDRFDAAYEAFRDLAEGLYDIDTRQYARGVTSDDAPGIMLSDGQVKLRELVHLPRNWPLARLTIPLGGQASGQAPWGLLLSDPGYQQWPGCTPWQGNPDSHALDIDPGWVSGRYHCVADA